MDKTVKWVSDFSPSGVPIYLGVLLRIMTYIRVDDIEDVVTSAPLTPHVEESRLLLDTIAYHLCNIAASSDIEPVEASFETLSVLNALGAIFNRFDVTDTAALKVGLQDSDDLVEFGVLVELQFGDERVGLRASVCDKQSAAANLDYGNPENISGVGSTALVEFQQRLQEVRNDNCSVLMYFHQTDNGLRFDYDISPDVDKDLLNSGRSFIDRLGSAF